jgi:hypothetical protein
MATAVAEVAQAQRRATAYLLSRQTPSGGFCFYRWGGIEEPNLADTAFALDSLQRLGQPVPNPDAVQAFARRFADARQPDALQHRMAIARALGQPPAQDDALRQAVAAMPWPEPPALGAGDAVSAWLRRARRWVALRRAVDLPIDEHGLLDALDGMVKDGGVGIPPNLLDTHAALDIAALCGRPLRREDVRQFVDSLQVPLLTFTLTALSRIARLDVIAAGVESCALLGLPLRYRADALRFVLGCQTAGGGFAPSPGALADIECTHAAVCLLQTLARD